MRVLPVLDLLNGVVVRGIAGQRSTYLPVRSQLASGADPSLIARAFRERFQLSACYLADLDAIMHGRPNLAIYRRLQSEGMHLLIDAGVRTVADARQVLESGAAQAVVGLESSPGPDSLRRILDEIGPHRVVFSLDLKEGCPLAIAGSGWEGLAPREIAAIAIEMGVDAMIVLDLAGVGMGRGIASSELCDQLRNDHSALRLVTGGGVRNVDDLEREARLGVAAVLVASALHDGQLRAAEVFPFTQGWPCGRTTD